MFEKTTFDIRHSLVGGVNGTNITKNYDDFFANLDRK